MYDSFPSMSHSDAPRWCPVCAVVLRSFVRNDVEMEWCPQCNGVWLDQGELDRLIRNSIQVTPIETTFRPRESGTFVHNSVPTTYTASTQRFATRVLQAVEAE